ncbi:MAG: hypothetical protein EOS50_05330 [Mesorhizobium sp.]|nr:MAG: hypothetical protein EOS50_05330 [Mesorhizobium sp.]
MDQSFIRVGQHVSSMSVARQHLQTPIFSLALDAEFNSLQTVNAPDKKFRKRIETMLCARDKSAASIPDTVLSKSMQSVGSGTIALAFEAYGIKKPHLYDLTAKGYIDEVVERRHAVAHGRESPIAVGVRKVLELRVRHDILYRQSMYVIECLNEFCGTKNFVLPRYRRSYPSSGGAA